jgi:Na+-translocating ferredoxin:NAD+ oxidoreductase subunit A
MDLGHYFTLVIGAILINNFILIRFLGTCPYIGVSKKIDSAVGMGFAVTFVMGAASAFTWLIYTFLLNPETNIFGGVDLSFLRTISFIVVIAALVQFVEMVIQKTSPVLYNALGIYLPLITTNCAVLGVAALNIDESYNFIDSVINGFAGGLGFTLAIILMAGIREKLEMADIPKPLRGVPIALIMAGLMSLAFMGFSGLTLK